MDLPAEFYLETVERIFQEHELPRGRFTGEASASTRAPIRRTALLTVEGERDDICALGQTVAAHDLCTGIRRSASTTTCSPASATTASSAAVAGRPRSIRSCAR